jgi:hypothetical protein
MIKETRVDRWESKANLSIKLSAEEVFALIPKNFNNAERVEVLTPFAKFWDRQRKELESSLHNQLIRVLESRAYDMDFRIKFCKKWEYDRPYFLWDWDNNAIMEMIYEKDSLYHGQFSSYKYTRKEIKENLNSFSELINKLSK